MTKQGYRTYKLANDAEVTINLAQIAFVERGRMGYRACVGGQLIENLSKESAEAIIKDLTHEPGTTFSRSVMNGDDS